MADNKLSDLSLTELLAKKKKLQSAIIGLGIVMFIACSTLIYLAILNKNYSLITVAIACSITMLPSIIVMNNLIKEIKSRK